MNDDDDDAMAYTGELQGVNVLMVNLFICTLSQ